MRILLRHGDSWQQVEPRQYSNEDQLQALLKESPELIPRIPPELPAVAYCREFPTAGYAIDLVGVGSDGSISLVECKLAKNREAKRTVVGQVLEYGASVWKMQPSEFEAAFAARAGQSPLEALRDAAIPEWDEAACRERMEDNLAHGRFRLLIAVDGITPELRGIIEYVNAQPGDLRLVALEFPYFAGEGGIEVLVPDTYGDEIAATETPAQRSASVPTLEDHLSNYPQLRPIHERLARLFGRVTTTPKQISYRGIVGDRELSAVQIYLPERRFYLSSLDDAGGDIAAIQREAESVGLVAGSSKSIEFADGEFPSDWDEHSEALVQLIEQRIAPLYH